MSFRPPPMCIDGQAGELGRQRLAEIAEDTARRIVDRLEIDADAPVNVVVGAKTSAVVGRTVTIALRSGGGLSAQDWFELLLAHELTHLLVREAWGLPPALFWEGLPVSLGDDHVRTRVLGHSYHRWCRALLELGQLLPLTPLLRASVYYRCRPDFRVDLVAGSLCGYLLRTRGATRVGDFVRAVAHPPQQAACWMISPASQRHLGGDVRQLEDDWIAWLRAMVPLDPCLRDRRARLDFAARPGRAHCDRCFSPLDGSRCTGCGRSDVRVDIG